MAILFSVSNNQIVDEKKKTEFVFFKLFFFLSEFKFRTNPGLLRYLKPALNNRFQQALSALWAQRGEGSFSCKCPLRPVCGLGIKRGQGIKCGLETTD